MFALRLVRGSSPSVLLRRLLVTVAAAGVGLLLLSALGSALSHPQRPDAALAHLLWCLVPLATAVQLAVSVARADPATRPRSGRDAAGLGPTRLSLLATVSTTVSCLLGSGVALLLTLYLRGQLYAVPFGGAGARLLGGGRSLPAGAVLLLLALLPVAAAAATAVSLRRDPPLRSDHLTAEADASPVPAPTGLSQGAVLVVLGLTMAASADHGAVHAPTPALLPTALGAIAPGAVAGWLLTGLGLVLAGPGLTHRCGRLLATGHPGPVRLLSGRVLQVESWRIGHPLGALCAIASGVWAAMALIGDGRLGPLFAVGAAVALCCAVGSLSAAAVEVRAARRGAVSALRRLGVSRSLLHGATALRSGTLLLVLAPSVWLIAKLAAAPLLP